MMKVIPVLFDAMYKMAKSFSVDFCKRAIDIENHIENHSRGRCRLVHKFFSNILLPVF